MAKRKRVEVGAPAPSEAAVAKKPKSAVASKSKSKKQQPEQTKTKTESKTKTEPTNETQPEIKTASESAPLTLQIVTGSYDRVLHGIIATISSDEVEFADSFLFNAHPSQIRCVAVSPPSAPAPGQDQKILLASGSTDPKINIYSLSAHPPKRRSRDELSKVAVRPILENSKNRELGLYNPHDSTVTKLVFPTRSKLISSSEDSTIAVAKTRNWEQMSSIKAPKPKAVGRPSGDTAALGDTPSGVNDFAVHPSMKLLLTVSKGERCMRLWNLLTGKKAAVLNFSRDMLQESGEGRHSSGEGRKVVWGPGAESEEFAVAFDRNIVVFGMDSLPKCRVMQDSKTKIHHFEYIAIGDSPADAPIMAVSTDDGRIALFSTGDKDLSEPPKDAKLKVAKPIAQIGGKEAGVTGRIKEFTVMRTDDATLHIVSGHSDGNVRVWKVAVDDLKAGEDAAGEETQAVKQIGKLLGTYSTDNRITCTTAFAMIPRPEGEAESDGEFDDEEEQDGSDEEED
ncbi:WD40-repeat-containing domain protein [Plectosphaerella plurivora]|uniref:WD40-repeat-containing domain protein n=1 Tax=Plectosphaerella plurivora TaxID=936078 RepID=A0A9P9ACV5_9PEZI|nr:WD40-repeat-containing domain protein [Plectosphaerella plurivora]